MTNPRMREAAKRFNKIFPIDTEDHDKKYLIDIFIIDKV